MNESKVTSVLIAAALGLLAALTTLNGVHIPSDTQAVIVTGLTLLAGFLAPAIVNFGTKFAKPIHALLTIAAAGLSFAVANSSLSPAILTALTGVIGFLTSLFVPSTAHPSQLDN